MKTKFLLATLFLCIGFASINLSGCSFGGHIGTSQTNIAIK